jgi:hypothetical protein
MRYRMAIVSGSPAVPGKTRNRRSAGYTNSIMTTAPTTTSASPHMSIGSSVLF